MKSVFTTKDKNNFWTIPFVTHISIIVLCDIHVIYCLSLSHGSTNYNMTHQSCGKLNCCTKWCSPWIFSKDKPRKKKLMVNRVICLPYSRPHKSCGNMIAYFTLDLGNFNKCLVKEGRKRRERERKRERLTRFIYLNCFAPEPAVQDFKYPQSKSLLVVQILR